MSKQGCACRACSEVVHVYRDQKLLLRNDLKLLEQAHCAHCWRPLRVATAWPGPREGQRPPYGNGSSMVVAQCGHIYHETCTSKLSHCGLCFSSLDKMIPLHYQDMSECYNSPPKTVPTKPGPKTMQESSFIESRDKSYLEGLISSLRDKIEQISAEVVQLRRLLKPQTPPRRWR
jgi:hypothetical protein